MRVSIFTASTLVALAQAAPTYLATRFNSAVPDISKRSGELAKRFTVVGGGQIYIPIFDQWNAIPDKSNHLKDITLDSYDQFACADACTATEGGISFDIFNIKNSTGAEQTICSIYSIGISKRTATTPVYGDKSTKVYNSSGYLKKSFQVTIEGWRATCYGSASIQPPPGANTFLGSSFNLPSETQCVDKCKTVTEENSQNPSQNGTYKACNMANFYDIYKNGVYAGNVCNLYTVQYTQGLASSYDEYKDGVLVSKGESCGWYREQPVGDKDGIVTVPKA
ncbi:hypothetical protein Dda_6391 [Drechslerella dactyloides]|uniref:Uncharacterized protein n=1 Tax=Drechslerella dactyloides TaxID=74499 RepID=A0AAD6ITY1_DREDA|nr:hypothetical protein Dda_6391 [Drechslerella dactyloides]